MLDMRHCALASWSAVQRLYHAHAAAGGITGVAKQPAPTAPKHRQWLKHESARHVADRRACVGAFAQLLVALDRIADDAQRHCSAVLRPLHLAFCSHAAHLLGPLHVTVLLRQQDFHALHCRCTIAPCLLCCQPVLRARLCSWHALMLLSLFLGNGVHLWPDCCDEASSLRYAR